MINVCLFSWLERRANNVKVTGLIPIQAKLCNQISIYDLSY